MHLYDSFGVELDGFFIVPLLECLITLQLPEKPTVLVYNLCLLRGLVLLFILLFASSPVKRRPRGLLLRLLLIIGLRVVLEKWMHEVIEESSEEATLILLRSLIGIESWLSLLWEKLLARLLWGLLVAETEADAEGPYPEKHVGQFTQLKYSDTLLSHYNHSRFGNILDYFLSARGHFQSNPFPPMINGHRDEVKVKMQIYYYQRALESFYLSSYLLMTVCLERVALEAELQLVMKPLLALLLVSSRLSWARLCLLAPLLITLFIYSSSIFLESSSSPFSFAIYLLFQSMIFIRLLLSLEILSSQRHNLLQASTRLACSVSSLSFYFLCSQILALSPSTSQLLALDMSASLKLQLALILSLRNSSELEISRLSRFRSIQNCQQLLRFSISISISFFIIKFSSFNPCTIASSSFSCSFCRLSVVSLWLSLNSRMFLSLDSSKRSSRSCWFSLEYLWFQSLRRVSFFMNSSWASRVLQMQSLMYFSSSLYLLQQ